MHGLNWKSYQRRPDCNFLLLFRKEGFSLLIVVFGKKKARISACITRNS